MYCWRMPIVFGRLPGPRQDASGANFKAQLKDTIATKATVKFEAEPESLSDLFPNDSYTFQDTSRAVTFTLSVESFQNLAWLGGGGYDLLALYVHGVQYSPTDGKDKVKGTYCPVMIENLADPILSGREELGVSKLFSDIKILSSNGSYRVEISWRGALWATIEWTGMEKVASGTAAVGDSLLVHKYIPATGSPGEADADYGVVIPYEPNASTARSSWRGDPSSCRIQFHVLPPKQLPTLHHVVRRLARLQDSRPVEATIVEYQGVPDLSNARRI